MSHKAEYQEETMRSTIRRVALAALTTITLLLVLPLPAFADNAITVDCGDGSPLTTSVDLPTLTSLQASIQGMLDQPSGMSCTLTQGGAVDPTLTIGTTSGGNAFVVGGGRYYRGSGASMQGCGLNFSISAHQDSTGFHGQQTITINNADGCSADKGQLKANVTCLNVSGNVAQIKGTISEASGPFFSSLAAPGDVLENDVVDNAKPSSGTADMIGQYPNPAGTGLVCGADPSLATFPVENGNITVHG